jgi:hypothetical protein
MFLFFYPVDNAKDFDRHYFDGMEPEKIASTLLDLKNEGECVPFYDLDNSHPNGRFLNMDDFTENYNDEDLDGGFWSIVVDVTYEQMRTLVDGEKWWTNGVYPNEQIPTT